MVSVTIGLLHVNHLPSNLSLISIYHVTKKIGDEREVKHITQIPSGLFLYSKHIETWWQRCFSNARHGNESSAASDEPENKNSPTHDKNTPATQDTPSRPRRQRLTEAATATDQVLQPTHTRLASTCRR